MSINPLDDAELVGEVVTRLLHVRDRLGIATFREAVDQALIGIGVAAHIEAERLAKSPSVRLADEDPLASADLSNVIRFPLEPDGSTTMDGQTRLNDGFRSRTFLNLYP